VRWARSAGVAFAAATMGGSMTAHAQSPESEARVLFQSGRNAMAAEDYARACPQLERSESLDPGIGTAFNLARCYELWGHLASASATYQRVVMETHAAGESQREGVARGLLAALEPRLARVSLVLHGAAPPLEVRIDGLLIDKPRWSIPLPVDPGAHVVEVSALAGPPFTAHFQVEREAQTVQIDVPPLLAPPAAPTPAVPLFWTPPPTEESAPGKTQRWTAIAAGGLSLVGAGIGTFFGLRALSLDHQASPYCIGGSCEQPGYSFLTQAHSSADAATVSFAAAGALVATAVVLWLTAPHTSHAPSR
jgi:hypothetical protein